MPCAVCVSARTLFLWSRNPLQIVYTDTVAPPDCRKRFAFAHGTLLGHLLVRAQRCDSPARAQRLSKHALRRTADAHTCCSQAGEERFAVELRRDDSVWYDIYTFSRPGCFLAQVSYPVARAQQRAFAKQSMAAVSAAVARMRGDAKK